MQTCIINLWVPLGSHQNLNDFTLCEPRLHWLSPAGVGCKADWDELSLLSLYSQWAWSTDNAISGPRYFTQSRWQWKPSRVFNILVIFCKNNKINIWQFAHHTYFLDFIFSQNSRNRRLSFLYLHLFSTYQVPESGKTLSFTIPPYRILFHLGIKMETLGYFAS